jgi:YVTN family beta-propeller protein
VKKYFFIIGILAAAFLFFPRPSYACFSGATTTYNSWSYCKQITIHHGQVSNTLGTETYTNFPVLISEASDTNLAASAQSSGNDILFVGSDDKTKLSHEIEYYASSTGQIVAWVRLPSVSTSTDTVINMYYGSSTAANQQNATSVWSSGYQLVQHLGTSGSGFSTTDSSGNGKTITNNGATATTTGQIEGGAYFNGTNAYYTFPTLTSNRTSTISAWINFPSIPDNENGAVLPRALYVESYNYNGAPYGVEESYNSNISDSNVSTSSWHLIEFVGNGTGKQDSLYIDGVQDAQALGTNLSGSYNAVGYDPNDWNNDAGNGGSATESFQGVIDEVRIASLNRSSDWIKTEYNNQNAPSSFYSIGNQFNVSGGFAATPTVIPSKHSGHITLSLTLSVGTLDTGWSSTSTVFSLSGVTGASEVTSTIVSSTAANLVLTTGSGTGTLVISDGVATTSVTVSPATLSVSPTNASIFVSTSSIVLSGVNTLWTQEATSGLFSVSGGTGASITTSAISSDNSASAVITPGSTSSTLVITDNSTGATTTLTVGYPIVSIASGSVSVGSGPLYATLVGTNLYVPNQNSNSVSVINTLTNTVTATIPVQGIPEFSTLVGTNLYVSNSGSSTVSVVNTLNNSVITTIPVGSLPTFSYLVGTNLYVNNTGGGGTVSVINTLTNTVTATVTVLGDPNLSTIVGTNIYLPTDSGVTVINTLNNSTSTILAASGLYATLAGTNLYVGSGVTSTVYVVDVNPSDASYNTVTATIPVGGTGSLIISTLVGKNLYVNNRSGIISVIDTNPADASYNTVTATIPAGGGLYASVLLGTNLYVPNSGTVTVINTLTNTVTATIPVGGSPIFAIPGGTDLYVPEGNSSVVVFDTLRNAILDVNAPVLSSFTSSSTDGTYTTGQSVNINANFGEALGASSTMTVVMNTGATVTLNNVSGTVLSGTYVVGSGDTAVPDLDVASIASAAVFSASGQDVGVSYAVPPPPQLTGFPFRNGNLGDTSNIAIKQSYFTIPLGTNPYQIGFAGNVAYVANEGSDTVSAYDTNAHQLLATIPVGGQPYGIVDNTSLKEVFVTNIASGTVSVIDANPSDVSTTYNTVPATGGGSATSTPVTIPTSTSGLEAMIQSLTVQLDTLLQEAGGSGTGTGSSSPVVSSGPITVTNTQADVACTPYLTGTIAPQGSNDPNQVLKLKQFLSQFEGATTLAMNGTYDAQTEAAVVAFQNKYQADILTFWGDTQGTGVVSITTRAKVNALVCGYEKPSLVCPYFSTYLKPGSTGSAVTKVQSFLNENDNANLPTTGAYDASTIAAVKDYQIEHAASVLTPWGLNQPTGLLLETTRKEMNRDLGCFEEPIRLPNGVVVE